MVTIFRKNSKELQSAFFRFNAIPLLSNEIRAKPCVQEMGNGSGYIFYYSVNVATAFKFSRPAHFTFC